MSGKWVIIGQSEWTIGGDADDIVNQVTAAMNDGSVAVLPLLDKAGRSVTVYMNGKTVESVVLDLSGAPRPSEIM